MTRTELFAALEQATGPSRELDKEIAGHCGYLIGVLDAPRFTSSIDAALTLVPEGFSLWRIDQYHDDKNPKWGWGVQIRNYSKPDHGMEVGESRASLPIAICIAALKARA